MKGTLVINHIAIKIGSKNFIEEAAKLNVNVNSYNYKTALRLVHTWFDRYFVATMEDGFVCLTNIREAEDLKLYKYSTLTIID